MPTFGREERQVAVELLFLPRVRLARLFARMAEAGCAVLVGEEGGRQRQHHVVRALAQQQVRPAAGFAGGGGGGEDLRRAGMCSPAIR